MSNEWSASSALQKRKPIEIKEYRGDEPTFSADTLAHHGVKGQKRGRRQYQNLDGSLTPLGRIHYGVGQGRDSGKDAEPNKNRNGSVSKSTSGQSTSSSSDDYNMQSKQDRKKIVEAGEQELTDEERALYKSNPDKYFDKLKKETDTSGIKDKQLKLEREQHIMNNFFAAGKGYVSERGEDLAIALYRRVCDEVAELGSGDIRNKEFEKKYEALNNKKDEYDEILDQVTNEKLKSKKGIKYAFKSDLEKRWEAIKEAGNDERVIKKQNEINKIDDELCGIALRAIGYEDDKESRAKMRGILHYD